MKTILWPTLNRYIPIWPTPKQAAFMAPLAQLEALYGGAGGGGKSVALLAAALMYVASRGMRL